MTENLIKITKDPLDIGDLVSWVKSPNCGAISVFLGTTRQDDNVVLLDYEAYSPMAEKTMGSICERARHLWPQLYKLAVVHRVGPVVLAEESVAVVASSPHRNEAIKATEYVIEQLKATVPIWKREVYADGQHTWKENKECLWKTTSV